MVHFKLSSTMAAFLVSSASLVSSLTVTQADFSALAARLISANSGLTLINGTFTGVPTQAGTYSSGPQGIADGIILSSGNAIDASKPKSSDASTNEIGAGSALCSAVGSSSYFDAAVLTLNLLVDKTKFNGLSVSFIFGSEEYPVYVGSSFNDVLGIFVNGKNVAMDNVGKPVTINNGFFASDQVATNDDSVYGGSTPILTANAPIDVGVSTVKLEIAVCDAADGALDSAVFLTLVKGIACQNNCEGVAVVAPTSTTPAPLPTINPKCARDNCLRGLLLKNGNFIESNYNDCKTALPTITVIPGPTSTQTITGPASLPTNANVCDGQGVEKRLARYISACGCVSVYPVTTTYKATSSELHLNAPCENSTFLCISSHRVSSVETRACADPYIMAIKRKVRKQTNAEPQFDGGGAKRAAINKYSDIAGSDEEAFDADQDKILLDGARRDARIRGEEMEELSDEEVLGLDGVDSESESDEEDPDAEEVEEGWGDSKKEYYDAEDMTDEEDLKAEEAEALRIQKKNLQKLDATAFVDDLDEWNDEAEQQDAVDEVPAQVSEDLPKLELQRMLKLRHPEFEPFARELQELSPQLEHLDLLAARTHHPEQNLIQLKRGALRSYLAVLAFYFVLLSSTDQDGNATVKIKEHEIMISLVRCRTAWQRIEHVLINENASDLVEHVPEPEQEPEIVNKKKRKRGNKSKSIQLSAPVVQESFAPEEDDDELEATFAALKSVKKIKPRQQLADIGDAVADSQEADDATQRRKTLQFYASQIAQKSNKRRDAGKNAFMSGDADVPYKERRKEREMRVQQEAERRKGGTIGADLDNEEPVAEKDAHSDEEYYDLIANAAKQEKQERKQAHDGALKALRAERAGYTLAEDAVNGDKRGVTRDILANKGTREGAKGPNKQNRNARVKKRVKYDAAKKKLASQKAIFKQPTGSYGGETSGISRVIKSTKLDGGMNKKR
ncbi:hypothetical protein BCR37DRAFT_405364 [Protomyces lactucae-debilis]|uniref:Sas10 C-terminal domain-containing protein n=1 Tax=Protomyces lactucae-debilis TaxID=2754530 RepID=A0A1Y2F5B5_PROLT|nr:uncharacterized protein BCR37DRAFT_405364 [Protomyces lactucae-debilis]ORY78536.1 hypothetical protein BCR37DRAFT_405364 [Protomyces lactucae-debilis]